MRLPPWALGLTLLLLFGCNKKAEATAEDTADTEAAADEEAAHEEGAKGHDKEGEKGGAPGAHGEKEAAGPKRFAVPFAWEASEEEPLARTRSFLQDVVRDNELNVRRGAKYFQPFASKQTPRVTVVACSDSRVQTHAWDATPDNDDFQIRNIGNQLKNAEGSVEYGVEHLHTPLLMIIGHTGCGAVKAAMGDVSALSAPIQHELAAIQLPKAMKSAEPSSALWAEAVVANVHAQVQAAVAHFNHDVAEQKLTVVGAVYDFRGDLGDPGMLHLVNVNANTDPERLAAFTKAVGGHVRNELGDDPTEGLLARVAQAARAMAAAEGHGEAHGGGEHAAEQKAAPTASHAAAKAEALIAEAEAKASPKRRSGEAAKPKATASEAKAAEPKAAAKSH
ncbi:MAG: carbonic anhydrase [Polyangiaceae bacterium]|nr:carbonic anhydrase [Polyangiaceae bacterium]